MDNSQTPKPEDNSEWAILTKDYQRLHEQRHLLEKELVELRGQVAWRNDALAVQSHTIAELQAQVAELAGWDIGTKAEETLDTSSDTPLTDSIALLRAKLAVMMSAGKNSLMAMELADKSQAGVYSADMNTLIWNTAKQEVVAALAFARGENK